MLNIDLSGKKALVSGVCRGIGLGIARQLARAGCDVAGCGLSKANQPGPRAFLKAVASENHRGVYQAVDITLKHGPQQWVDQASRAIGGVDILVSNAGRNFFSGVENCDDKTWKKCIDLNLTAHLWLAKAARPYLLKSAQPVIIIITSNHAWRTIAGCFPYNVAKAGLVAMVQSLAIEFGPRIRTVGIAPGFIDTPSNDEWFKSFPDPAAERARAEQKHPVHRLGTVDEIGALCAFLASNHAAFISGTTLLVDGGVGALM
ncbi:MAG TPA: SDR family oxidoreductase [Verrucomicrobiae bacterium]|nr:SDR family oxidoreductase [Verrucomicrobiae bacterium]